MLCEKALGILVSVVSLELSYFHGEPSRCQCPEKESCTLILRLVEKDLQVLFHLLFSDFCYGAVTTVGDGCESAFPRMGSV